MRRLRLVLGLLGAAALTSSCQLFVPTAPVGGRNANAWQYDVTASPGAVDLSITATFPRGTDVLLSMIERADTFVVGVEVEQQPGKPWREVRRVGTEWRVPECSKGCRVRYRYLLADGAGTWGDIAMGRQENGVTLAPPSTWLLRPEHAKPGTAIRFHVTTAPGDVFVTGVFAAPDVPASSGIYEAHVGDYLQLPYSAFGPLHLHELAAGAATLAVLPGVAREDDVVAWTESALASVRDFYGRPPAPHVLIVVKPGTGDEVGFGKTMGFSGASIVVNVGRDTTKAGFHRDWVLVHELVHTALPDLPEEQHWLEEGLATYVEPLARYRHGDVTEQEVWSEWAHRMKLGEPEAGDQGLDQTHTWGRTYWGGALFCLLADVEIRTRTSGKSSLEGVLRAILDDGGNIATSWSIDKVLDLAKRVTGTDVFRETYEKMAKLPTPVDLPTMWRRLGVVVEADDRITFDDKAELAWVRHSMTPLRESAPLVLPAH